MTESAAPPAAHAPDTAIAVRLAAFADLDALVAIEDRAFSQDRISRRSFRHFLHHRSNRLWVASRGEAVLGYVLVLFRRGTSLSRVYSIAVDPGARGAGVAGVLLDEAERAAVAAECMVMRLEVREDNAPAIALYERRGYRPFGRFLDYYEDHAPARRYQKWLKVAPAGLRQIPYYRQTTEFSCGPAVLMMAMAGLDPERSCDRRTELRLWREATTIFMSAGHGGCEPIGLGLALVRRGFGASVHVSEPGPYFLGSVRDPQKREVMTVIQEVARDEAQALGMPIDLPALDTDELRRTLDGGGLVAALISHYRMTGDKEPHWVLVFGHDGRRFFLHDPWFDHDALESALAAASLPVPFREFERMARFGTTRLRASIVIRARAPQEQYFP